MSSASAAVVARLNEFTALTSLVSDRIYRYRALDLQAQPYIVVYVITDTKNHAMGADINPAEARIQVTVFSSDGPICDQVAAQVHAALNRWSGTINGTVVQSIFHVNETESYEVDTDYYQKNIDYRVFYEEA